MPKKHLLGDQVPSLVAERLRTWGICIKTLRLAQKLRVHDLCARIDVTHTTLRRLEQGDPGASAGLYLSALMVLGAIDIAAPPLPSHLVDLSSKNNRVRLSYAEDIDHDF